MIKLAAVQMVSGIDVTSNLNVAERLISEAVSSGASLLVLPENFAYKSSNDRDKLAIKEPFGNGPIQDFLAEQSAKHKITLVAGTIPVSSPIEEKVYAASLVYNSEGKCIAKYNKIHLFDVKVEDETYLESSAVMPGDEVVVVDLPFARLGLSVCYDIRFPEMYRSMLQRDVDIIVIPSAFTFKTGEAHWEILVRARAIENLSYVMGVNQGGEHPGGNRTYGHSMIVDPWGKIKDSCEFGEGVIISEFDQDSMKNIHQKFPARSHKRLI